MIRSRPDGRTGFSRTFKNGIAWRAPLDGHAGAVRFLAPEDVDRMAKGLTDE